MESFAEKLEWISPQRLVSSSEEDVVADFFLVLGTIYNDLKNLMFHLKKVNEDIKELSAGITPESGECGGIKTHIERQMFAVIHELFETILKSEGALSTGEFSAIYNSLNRDFKDSWDRIVKIAKGESLEEEVDLSKVLMLIRHHLSAHYSAKELRRGFIDFFYNVSKNPANEKAYYAIGENMRKTRFYYCDAAAKQSTYLQIKRKMDTKDFSERFEKVINAVNFTIMDLMKIYIKNRPYPREPWS